MCVVVYIARGGRRWVQRRGAPRTERRTAANYTYNLPKQPKTLHNALVRQVKVNKSRSFGVILLSKPL